MFHLRILASAFLVGGLLVCAGCGGKGYEGPRRAQVSGAVSFNGQPIVEGSITLTPVGHTGAGASVPIENGSYMIPEPEGPNPGTYKVQIYGFQNVGPARAAGPGGEEDAEAQEANLQQVIPPQYNAQTTLEIEVTEGENTQDFNLTP